MRVFVTGAAGRVGRVLVAQLVASGHAVSGLVSDQGKAEALRAAGAEPVVGRLEDAAALDRGVADAEVVYHLAGGVRGAGSVTADALNHQGTRRLVEAIQRRPDAGRGLASLLFSSTTAIYGDRSGLWVDEQMAPFPQTLYGASKVAAEALLSRAAREDGLPVRIARLAAVYGPDFPFLMADRMAKGKAWLPGEGRNYVPVIHVEDAAAALVAVAERGEPGGVYNVSDTAPPTLGAFYAEVHRIVGGQPVRFWSTWVPSYVQFWIADTNERVAGRLGRRPRLTPDALRMFTASCRMKVTRLEDELGFQWRYPVYKEGLAATFSGR